MLEALVPILDPHLKGHIAVLYRLGRGGPLKQETKGSFKGGLGSIYGRFRADLCKKYGCFYDLGVLLDYRTLVPGLLLRR